MVLFPADQLGLQIPNGALHGPRSQGLTKEVQLLFGAEKTLQDHKYITQSGLSGSSLPTSHSLQEEAEG